MKSDIVDVMDACIDNKLDDMELLWDENPSVCIVMASGGYPNSYDKGKQITGISKANESEDVFVFHAGTSLDDDNNLITSGGRVLGVTALGKNIKEAVDTAYNAVSKIDFEKAYFRKDIAKRALDREG